MVAFDVMCLFRWVWLPSMSCAYIGGVWLPSMSCAYIGGVWLPSMSCAYIGGCGCLQCHVSI